jgi:Peptidase A4 family
MKRLVVFVAFALPLLAVPLAHADSGASSNWAGYAVHRPGVKFNHVIGEWTQPRVQCRRNHPTYSAVWVGLGGFSQSSQALEQIGTEVDCTGSGRVVSSAWYELVPAASRSIQMRVNPGDQLAASVAVNGHQVVVALVNLTTHASFSKTLEAPLVDITSADWIVEAPSECFSASSCATLPLANFGAATFSNARAESVDGHVGTISDPAWGYTEIRLRPQGRRFVSRHGPTTVAGGANPSTLSTDGSSFTVTFLHVSVRGRYALSRRAYLEHRLVAAPF